MTIAIFPGTFDPITKGHEDLVRRASKLFERLILGVATSARKQPYFSLDDRLAMAKLSLQGMDNVEVVAFSGLLIDCATEHQASVIIRGLRAVSDFDYEFQMAGMNRSVCPDVETIFLPSTHEYAYISATMVREIMDLGRDPSHFLDARVLEYLQR